VVSRLDREKPGLTQPDNDASVYPLLCQVDVGLSHDGGGLEL
jgi:hypothetical protein